MRVTTGMCAFKNCGNRKKGSALKFFGFPYTLGERRDQWIKNCGHDELKQLVGRQLTSMSVCQLHFTEACFTNSLYTRISMFAIPTLDGKPPQDEIRMDSEDLPNPGGVEGVSPHIEESNLGQDKGLENDLPRAGGQHPAPPVIAAPSHVFPANKKSLARDTPRVEQLKKKIHALRKEKKKYYDTLRSTRLALKREREREIEISPEEIVKAASKYVSDNFLTLLEMQLLHKDGLAWTKEEKELALKFYYMSTTSYFKMRNSMGFRVPCKTIIQTWLKEAKVKLVDESSERSE